MPPGPKLPQDWRAAKGRRRCAPPAIAAHPELRSRQYAASGRSSHLRWNDASRCAKLGGVSTDKREPATAEIVPTAEAERTRALSRDEDLPVVARMVIEIRSDGTRTVARGAVEDVATGQQAAVVARGGSPVALAADLTRGLARSLGALPFAAGSAVLRRLLGRGRRDR